MSANQPLPVPQRLTGNLFTVVSMLFWATGFPVTERLLDDWDPLTLVFVRIGLAGLVLALLWPLMSPGYAWRRLPWGRVMWVGGIGLGLGTLFLVWGQHYSDPITVAVLATTVPLVSAIMGAWAGEERLSGRLLVAIGTSVETVDAARAAVSQELERLLHDGVEQAELDDARSYLLGREPFRRETARQYAELDAQAALYGLPLESAEWMTEKLADLDRERLADLAREHVRPGELSTTIGLPAADPRG